MAVSDLPWLLALGGELERFVRLGLRDDNLLLATGLVLEVHANPGDAKWTRAAARVHAGPRTKVTIGGEPIATNEGGYWLTETLRRDLPRHVPAHEQPDGPILTCIAPMIRRPLCGRNVPLRPWSSSTGRAIPVLVGEHVTWHAYCRQHDVHGSTRTVVRGTPEAEEAARRLRHNVGGQLRDALPHYRIEEGYVWVDKRWQPDDRPVEPVRLRLVPPIEDAEED